jgi:hypothetical protein
MTQQAAFDAAWMNPDAEAFLDQLHQIRQPNGWFFLAHLADECEDFLGEFVRLLRTSLVRRQAGQSVLSESG